MNSDASIPLPTFVVRARAEAAKEAAKRQQRGSIRTANDWGWTIRWDCSGKPQLSQETAAAALNVAVHNGLSFERAPSLAWAWYTLTFAIALGLVALYLRSKGAPL